MRAGKLRHRVTIERQSTEQDEYGQLINQWNAIGTYPASVEPLNGREYFTAHSMQSEVTTKIKMRYMAGIEVTDRIVHGGKVYNILSAINPEMRNEELILMCKSIG